MSQKHWLRSELDEVIAQLTGISIYPKEVLLLEFLFCPFHKPASRIQR